MGRIPGREEPCRTGKAKSDHPRNSRGKLRTPDDGNSAGQRRFLLPTRRDLALEVINEAMGNYEYAFAGRFGDAPLSRSSMHNALRGNKKTKGICKLLGLAAFTPTVGFRPLRRKTFASELEVGACSVENQRGAADLFTGIGARIEAALPLPAFKRTGVAHAAGDGADVNVAEIDVPAVGAFGISAAGEFGQSPRFYTVWTQRRHPGRGFSSSIVILVSFGLVRVGTDPVQRLPIRRGHSTLKV
jgi:hypothetical protein